MPAWINQTIVLHSPELTNPKEASHSLRSLLTVNLYRININTMAMANFTAQSTSLWLVVLQLLLAFPSVHSFVVSSIITNQAHHTTTTRLYIDDRIAKMIDQELYRQEHRTEFENEWMEHNRPAILQSLHRNGGSESETSLSSSFNDNDQSDSRQYHKDLFMASRDPQRYCADRCVATGNCDVYEDLYQLSPLEVRAFCEECVLSEEEAPCDVPEAFFFVEGEDDTIVKEEDVNEDEMKLFFETNDPIDSSLGGKDQASRQSLAP